LKRVHPWEWQARLLPVRPQVRSQRVCHATNSRGPPVRRRRAPV